MKKSLVAVAVLGAFAGVASAQTNITLFGVADVNYQYADGSGSSANRLNGSGSNASSRLGLRGSEDLGGGMRASFWLEAGINPDDGTGQGSNSSNQLGTGSTTGAPVVNAGNTTLGANASLRGGQGLTFNRRSTVSLAGKWGELRLGRDYTPTFWNLTMYDPFGTVGSGAMTNVALNAGLLPGSFGATGGAAGIRASNSIQYVYQCGGADAGAPCQTGGFFGQAMYAFGENASNAVNSAGQDISSDGNYWGGRIGYGTAKWSVAGAYSKTNLRLGTASDITSYNVSGNYDFGFVNLMGTYFNYEANSNPNLTLDGWMLGAVMPLGPGQLKGSWTSGKASGLSGGDAKANQYAIGYVYPMSKRTALYGTFSYLDNGSNAALSGGGGVTVNKGDAWTGIDLGVRHIF